MAASVLTLICTVLLLQLFFKEGIPFRSKYRSTPVKWKRERQVTIEYTKKTFKVVLPETGSWDTVLVSLFVSVFVWNLHGCLSAFCVLVGNAVCACVCVVT